MKAGQLLPETSDTMPSSSLFRLPGRFLLAPALFAPATLFAQLSAPASAVDSLALDRVVVSATRSPQDIRSIPSSVTAISLDDLAVAQVGDLRTALSEQPGVLVYNTGAFGSTSSVSIRGGNAYQTLLIVDGVRMNDRSADDGTFLGGADLANFSHFEVLRGPQSTLYGSSAMGGVILIDSVTGQGPTTGEVSLTAGSFDTLAASAGASGSIGDLSYSGVVSHFETANDRAYNHFRDWSLATRAEYRLNSNLNVGTTFRLFDGRYEEPGSTAYFAPGSVNEQNDLATFFAEYHTGDDFTSKLTLGLHHRLYDFYSSDFGDSPVRNVRQIFDWQNTWEISREVEIVAGTDFENSHYVVAGSRSTDRLGAGYISTTLHPRKDFTLTGGVRYDHYKSAGSATTYHFGLAWNPTAEIKVHSTFGTGFTAPGSDDRYGVPDFGELPNPDLQPEKSTGWDVGVSEDFAGGRGSMDVTYFRNHYRNMFQWHYVDEETFTGQIINVARAQTDGAEVSLKYRLSSQWSFRGAYTYLDATDESLDVRLGRRPRHVADVDVAYQIIPAWTLGAGAHWVADQVDELGQIPDYTTVRLFTSYAVLRNLTLKLRLENALDRHYEEVRGYPALPFGAFGSVDWKF